MCVPDRTTTPEEYACLLSQKQMAYNECLAEYNSALTALSQVDNLFNELTKQGALMLTADSAKEILTKSEEEMKIKVITPLGEIIEYKITPDTELRNLANKILLGRFMEYLGEAYFFQIKKAKKDEKQAAEAARDILNQACGKLGINDAK